MFTECHVTSALVIFLLRKQKVKHSIFVLVLTFIFIHLYQTMQRRLLITKLSKGSLTFTFELDVRNCFLINNNKHYMEEIAK